MKAIVVDDEQLALENLTMTLKEFDEISQVIAFKTPQKALCWLEEHRADVAFLDINMNQMDGLELAKRLKELAPGCAVVFVTGYSQYALQAIQMRASGYLMKPVRKQSIREELDYILYPPEHLDKEEKTVYVRCFGNFEVFAGREPMKFKYNKTKELLAYLVDRKGAFCSNGEIVNILWEGQPASAGLFSQFRNLLADLTSAFKAAGKKDAVLKRRGMTAIAPDKIQCDYYSWIKGEIKAINSYRGEYMSQYSWGEFTLGGLESSSKKK